MRKSTMTGVIIFLICAVIAGLFAFFAWATDWFSSSARLRKMFSDEPAPVTPAASEIVNHGLSKSAVNDNNIYLDSDDVATTVAVNYASAPFVAADSSGLYVFYQYATNVGPQCEVRIGLKQTMEEDYKSFVFNNDIRYPYIQNHTNEKTNKHYISIAQLQEIADELDWDGEEKLFISTRGLAFSTVGPSITCLDSSWSFHDFEFITDPAVMSLSGATLTIQIPDGVYCSYPNFFMDIVFSDGESFEQYFYDGKDGCTISGNTYTVDLTKLTCINTPTDCITVSAFLGGGTLAMNYVFPMNTLSFSIQKLANPTNIHYDQSGILTWDEIEGAHGYRVFFDDTTSEFVQEPQYDFNGMKSGTYNIRIRAIGNVGEELAKSARMTAFNASANIQQIVALTYDIDGDTVTKFVPYGKSLSDYLYEVELDGRQFGGWYYDKGFSSRVLPEDTADKDMTIYARLSSVQVIERQLTWFERHKWQVLIPCFVVGGLVLIGIFAGAIVKKKKSGK